MSPTSDNARSDVALNVCLHNGSIAQSAISGGAPSCLLHQASAVAEQWSPFLFATSFCRVSQLWRIISRSTFTELALCRVLALTLFLGLKPVVHHSLSASNPVSSSVCSTSCSKDYPTNPMLFLQCDCKDNLNKDFSMALFFIAACMGTLKQGYAQQLQPEKVVFFCSR